MYTFRFAVWGTTGTAVILSGIFVDSALMYTPEMATPVRGVEKQLNSKAKKVDFLPNAVFHQRKGRFSLTMLPVGR